MFRKENIAINKLKDSSSELFDPPKNKIAHIKNGAISNNYNRYFSTGFYKLRYPNVNRHTLSLIQNYTSTTTPNYHILDYGCGDGRYLTNLLLRHSNTFFTAYDISKTPLRILREKLIRLKQTSRVKVFDNFNLLVENNSDNSPFDMALLLFGVLSHIPSTRERQGLLSYLRDNIGTGYLILSVPNKQRRFLKAQQEQGSHEITYTRHINEQVISLHYHLYSEHSIKQELNDAGLEIIKIKAESRFPESWVTRFKPLGWLDHQLCKYIPARWGYGILICCKNKKTYLNS